MIKQTKIKNVAAMTGCPCHITWIKQTKIKHAASMTACPCHVTLDYINITKSLVLELEKYLLVKTWKLVKLVWFIGQNGTASDH